MDEANRRVHEALDRARTGQTLSNYPAIFAGFMAKGVAEADIKPSRGIPHCVACRGPT